MLMNGGAGSFDTNFHTSQKPVSQIKYAYDSIVWTDENIKLLF
jgi:hypothetical protein